MIHWNKADRVPLPPVGTRVLVYHPELGEEPWAVGVLEGRVDADLFIAGPVVETANAILSPTDPGWWWAFVGELPDSK